MTAPTRKREIISILLLAVVTLAIGAAAITHQSFWMDEANGALKALMPTFKDWRMLFFRLGGSDVQMPFYMASLWGWHKLGFTSEYAMRCINLPFLVLMVLALRKVRFWPLVCLTSPFVLYYTGELRPYAMQMAGGALAALGLWKASRSDDPAPYPGLQSSAAAGMLLVTASLSSAVWAAGLAVGLLILRPGWIGQRGFWLRILPWLAIAAGLGAYYAFALLEGYRAAPTGGDGLLSIGFGFYEMAGLLGIGPSRNELRDSPMALIPQLPWVLPAAFCLMAAWLYGVSDWLRSSSIRLRIAVATAVVLPLLALAIVGLMADFRVLGRHLSPAIPAVLLPIALCAANASRSRARLAAGTLAVLVAVASATSLRFAEKHARDDCRGATHLAIEALKKKQVILWQAGIGTSYYYAYQAGGWPYFNAMQTLVTERPSGYMFADLVFINRPDLHYKGQDHREILRREGFDLHTTLQGFEVWKNRDSPCD